MANKQETSKAYKQIDFDKVKLLIEIVRFNHKIAGFKILSIGNTESDIICRAIYQCILDQEARLEIIDNSIAIDIPRYNQLFLIELDELTCAELIGIVNSHHLKKRVSWIESSVCGFRIILADLKQIMPS
jgi:hypothetical protein